MWYFTAGMRGHSFHFIPFQANVVGTEGTESSIVPQHKEEFIQQRFDRDYTKCGYFGNKGWFVTHHRKDKISLHRLEGQCALGSEKENKPIYVWHLNRSSRFVLSRSTSCIWQWNVIMYNSVYPQSQQTVTSHTSCIIIFSHLKTKLQELCS